MISLNFLPDGIEITNDIEDFKMPYRLYGRTDLEITINQYQRLRNQSHGLTRRFNYGSIT